MRQFAVLISAVQHVQEVTGSALLDFYTRQDPSLMVEPVEMEEATFYAVSRDHVPVVQFIRGEFQTADPTVAAALLMFDRSFVPDPPDAERKQVIAGDWIKRLRATLEKVGVKAMEPPEPGPVEIVSEADVIPEEDRVENLFGKRLGTILAGAGYPSGTSLRALSDPALEEQKAALSKIKGVGSRSLEKILAYIEGKK